MAKFFRNRMTIGSIPQLPSGAIINTTPINLSSGRTPTFNFTPTFNPSGSAGMITDGVTTTEPYLGGSENSLGTVTIDLGATYTLSSIKQWHYFSDGRSYHQNKTEISLDGSNWTTVFDSAVNGEYSENSSGKIITFTPTSARYFRNSINTSTANVGNHWVELQAWGY